jgi:hypothetical protein
VASARQTRRLGGSGVTLLNYSFNFASGLVKAKFRRDFVKLPMNEKSCPLFVRGLRRALLARMQATVDNLCAERDKRVGEQRIEYPDTNKVIKARRCDCDRPRNFHRMQVGGIADATATR